MSIRLDLLPMTYCLELSKLLDRVPPFDSDEAIATVERTTGRPLEETFAAFDPEPIGSASLACVYQAVLKSGERVAVKVRRPGIVSVFAADRRALGWLIGLAELLTLVRPGQLRELLHDLETMFMEELDFRKEARFTDLFRRRAKKSRLRFISAPRIYFELSSDEVLVSEFVSGIWLWELLWAVESGDEEALDYVARLDIDPAVVARRLFRASLFGIFENLIFHADPHPANVVVQRGGEIVLIDFGSCGSYTEGQIRIVRQFNYCQANEDSSGMVQCILALLEPLPPIDVDALARDVEGVFAESLQALKSPSSEWWERTSAGVWIGFMKVARKYHLRVHLDILRMIRSTLLYDTLAVRLHKDLDIYREYRRYRKQMAKGARRRFRRRLRRLFRRGLDDRLFLRFEELSDLGQRLVYRAERLADAQSYKFSYLAGKAVFAVSTLVQAATLAFTVGGVGAAAVGGGRLLRGEVGLLELAGEVAGSTWFVVFAAVLLVVSVRRILFRFSDKEV
jgi:predicted unusual protein kinase regulating ubiquinone biosynthesis (AarF/ABC1/UbiB family)